MSNSVNRVQLLGNVGQSPELRATQSGTSVLSLRMATNERFKDKAGEWQERAEWHTVVVWGKRAEGLAKLDLKGSKIYVDGRLQTRSWEDKEGNKRYSTEIVAQDVVLLGAPRGAQERQPGDDDPGPTAPRHTSGPATVDPGWPDPTDDLPF